MEILEEDTIHVNSYYTSEVLPAVSFPILSEEHILLGAALWLQKDSLDAPLEYHIRPVDGAEVVIPYSLSETFFMAKDSVNNISFNKNKSDKREDNIYGLLSQVDMKLDYYKRGLNIDLFSECFAIDDEFAYYIFHDDYRDIERLDGTPCLYWAPARQGEDEAGWHISLTSLKEELSLGFVRYDDRAGIEAFIESLKDPESLLVRLALSYREEAENLASKVLLRKLTTEGKLPNMSLKDLRDSLLENNLGSATYSKERISGGLDLIILRFDKSATVAGVMIRIPNKHNIIGYRTPVKMPFSAAGQRLYSAAYTSTDSEFKQDLLTKLLAQEQEENRKEYEARNPYSQRVKADRLAWQTKFEEMIEKSPYHIVYKKIGEEGNGCDYIVSTYSPETWRTLSKQIKEEIDHNLMTAWSKDSSF